MKNYSMTITGSITGGKYKELVYDDYGEEKVITGSKPYGISVRLTFE